MKMEGEVKVYWIVTSVRKAEVIRKWVIYLG